MLCSSCEICRFWAGEDTPTAFGNWTGASCWGRKLNQHYLKMNATSTVAWAVVWSTYPGTAGQFMANAFVNASEPWSGHYDVLPIVWINAHWHQFANPGWRFLQIGPDGGAGMLAGGGSYVTLVPPADDASYPPGTFTLIVETLFGSCGTQVHCNVDPITAVQAPAFILGNRFAATHTVHLWCSGSGSYFVYKGIVQPVGGVLTLQMQPDTICTATTLANGTKGEHPIPPPSTRFPTRHVDGFATYAEDTLAYGFSDVYGSFAVRDAGNGVNALTQVAAAKPTGWAPTNYDPLTFIGDSLWRDVRIGVTAIVNHTDADHYVLLCGGCGVKPVRVIEYACDVACCFNLSWTGNWTVGQPRQGLGASHSGHIAGFQDTWHALGLAITNGSVTAAVDGVTVAELPGNCATRGLAALGCGSYHMCAFRNLTLEGSL